MLKLEKQTKLSPAEVLKQAIEFFVAGYGLKITEQNATCMTLEGGGGGIEITTSVEKKVTSVEVSSQEWDRQAKTFISKLK